MTEYVTLARVTIVMDYRRFLYDHRDELADMIDDDDYVDEFEKAMDLKWDELDELGRMNNAYEYFAFEYEDRYDDKGESAYDQFIEYRKRKGWQ